MTRLINGVFVEAGVAFEEAIDAALSAEDPALVVATIEGFAALGAATEEWERAARLFGFVAAFRVTSGISDPLTSALAAPYVDLARQRLTQRSGPTQAWEEGRQMTLDEAVACARNATPAIAPDRK